MSTTKNDLLKEKIVKGGLTFLHSKAVWNLSTPDSLLWAGLTSVSENPLTILEELRNENSQLRRIITDYEEKNRKLTAKEGFLKLLPRIEADLLRIGADEIKKLKAEIEHRDREIAELKEKTISGKEQKEPEGQLKSQSMTDADWARIIAHPSVIVVLGKRGSGKTALAYRLLELLRFKANLFVYRFPIEKRGLLPNWIGSCDKLEGILRNSIVLIDESYLYFHSRRSPQKENLEIAQMLNLSRQRNQSFIFVTQGSSQIDKSILSAANVFIIKELGVSQLRFDRPELKDVLKKAKERFDNLSPSMRKKSGYLYSSDCDFSDLLEISLPTFWSEELSKVYGQSTSQKVGEIMPKPITKEQRVRKVKELRKCGYSLGDISKVTGIPKTTVCRYAENTE